MSGVFSIASHCVLQYFPTLIWQEQFGCAHFLLSAIALSQAIPNGPGIHLARFAFEWEYGKACRIAGDSRQLP
jgi:hypothetical protein